MLKATIVGKIRISTGPAQLMDQERWANIERDLEFPFEPQVGDNLTYPLQSGAKHFPLRVSKREWDGESSRLLITVDARMATADHHTLKTQGWRVEHVK